MYCGNPNNPIKLKKKTYVRFNRNIVGGSTHHMLNKSLCISILIQNIRYFYFGAEIKQYFFSCSKNFPIIKSTLSSSSIKEDFCSVSYYFVELILLDKRVNKFLSANTLQKYNYIWENMNLEINRISNLN